MQTEFGKALEEALEARHMSINQLAKEAGSSYEYCRQLLKGNAYPGRNFVKVICSALKMDFPSTWNLVVQDKLKRTYGAGAIQALGKNPRFLEIERLLPQLTDQQFEFILGAVEGIARRNRLNTATANVSEPVKAEAKRAKEKYLSLGKPKTKQAVHLGILTSEMTNEVKR